MQTQNVVHSLTIISQATDFGDVLISLRVKPADTYGDTGHFASHSGFREVPFSLLALLLQWYKITWAAHACWQWRGGGGETAEGTMSGNRDGGGRDVPPHPFPLMHFTKHPNTILHRTANTHFQSVTDLSWCTEQHWSTILGGCVWAQFFYRLDVTMWCSEPSGQAAETASICSSTERLFASLYSCVYSFGMKWNMKLQIKSKMIIVQFFRQ